MKQAWEISSGRDSVVAAAIHAGHEVRPEVREALALDEEERLREEDPYTDLWTRIAATRIVVHRSRFEVDMNRPRDGAVYLRPEDAWGLEVWKEGEPTPGALERSLALYDSFYEETEGLLARIARALGRFVVLDLHSYNFRREGPHEGPADSAENPDINLGIESVPDSPWHRDLVESFCEAVAEVRVEGRCLDVRPDVRFRGGHFPRWINDRFGEVGCAIAVEVKKIFMDEWTGTKSLDVTRQLRDALAVGAEAIRERLSR